MNSDEIQQSTTILVDHNENVPLKSKEHKIHDWLLWSFINIFFGFGVGFIPLIFSLICRCKKHDHDLKSAQKMSTVAFTLNIATTIIEIINWIGLISYIFVHIHSESFIDKIREENYNEIINFFSNMKSLCK
ncbi:unnamed protein product [Adineta steineri]|uniref:Uncharacterized protein n=1 Tax=Adineta steineri TaxID=433720 RepID=A0A815LGJ7_9BILA|nr:unnamed protein product [Adineta steineri]CAF1615866.1 unnamed protein product [Adineta steineri]